MARRHKTYKVIFPGSTGEHLSKGPYQTIAYLNWRAEQDNKDVEKMQMKCIISKIKAANQQIAMNLELRRDKLTMLLKQEDQFLKDQVKQKIDSEKHDHLQQMKEKLARIQIKNEEERLKQLNKCLAMKEQKKMAHHNALLKAQYATDLCVQLEMNMELRQQKKEDDSLLEHMKTFTQWEGDRDFNQKNLEMRRTLREGLHEQVVQNRLEAVKKKEQLIKDIDETASLIARIKVEDAENAQHTAQKKIEATKDLQRQIKAKQVQRANVKAREAASIDFVLNNSTLASDFSTETILQNKLNNHKEMMDYLQYARTVAKEKKEILNQVDEAFRCEIDEINEKDFERRQELSKARQRLELEIACTQKQQIAEKKLRNCEQSNVANTSSGFLETVFKENEKRASTKIPPEHLSVLERQIAERIEEKKTRKEKESASESADDKEEVAGQFSSGLHPFANTWRRMLHEGRPGVPGWTGSLQKQDCSV